MAEDHLSQDHVLINLSTLTPEVISFPERRVVLTESNPTLQIGRASNRLALGLQSDTSNGWFDSPVMSRNHAKISADIAKKRVYIEDTSSMHGTYLNSDKLISPEQRPLTTGDKLVFGMAVYRNQQTFQPTTVKVDIEFRAASLSTTSPSRIFTVPDDCSTDENEPLEEDIIITTKGSVAEATASTPGIADTKQDSLVEPPAFPQLDGPVDAGTTSSEAPPSSYPIIETFWDDDQSIRLTESSCSSSEYSSHSPPSPKSLKDLVETVFMTCDDNESESDSWSHNSVQGGDEDTQSNTSEEEGSMEGVFIYDSEESDEMDCGFDHIDTDSESDEPLEYPNETGSELDQPLELTRTLVTPAAGPFLLPSINEALSWTSGLVPRPPSPSDAVLPYAPRRPSGEEFEPPRVGALTDINGLAPAAVSGNRSQGEVSVHTLGQISGKPDFFQAREHNKMTLAEAIVASRNPMKAGQNAAVRNTSVDPPKQDTCGACNINDPHPSPKGSRFPEFPTRPPVFPLRPPVFPRDCGSWLPQHSSTAGPLVDFGFPDWYPGSAYELQQLKKRQQLAESFTCSGIPVGGGYSEDLDSEPPALQSGGRSSDPSDSHTESTSDVACGLTSIPCVPKCLSTVSEPKVSATETQQDFESNREPSDSALADGIVVSRPAQSTAGQTSSKGKRKADEISSLTEVEMNGCYAAAPFRADKVHAAQLRHLPIKDSSRASFGASTWTACTAPPAQPIPVDNAHRGLPSPPTTPDGQAGPEPRPNKRIKRIAERVGFAALGGATVGALVISSLIYTAPNFV